MTFWSGDKSKAVLSNPCSRMDDDSIADCRVSDDNASADRAITSDRNTNSNDGIRADLAKLSNSRPRSDHDSWVKYRGSADDGNIVRAQAEREFLRPAQAAKMLADSCPWAATRADGREAKVTFNPDGTGTFEGPMTLSSKWTIKGDDICITMTVIGVKCHRFAKVSGGLDAYTDGAVDLRLRR